MFSRRFCTWLAAGYVSGAMPWSLAALVVKYNYLPYQVSRYTTASFGALLLLRAWLGAGWILKLAYTIRWLLTIDMYRRDDIGNALVAGAPVALPARAVVPRLEASEGSAQRRCPARIRASRWALRVSMRPYRSAVMISVPDRALPALLAVKEGASRKKHV